MQTMPTAPTFPTEWPLPATPPPTPPRRFNMGPRWCWVMMGSLGLIAALGVGAFGAVSSAADTQNGWTKSEISQASSTLLDSGLSVEDSACLLNYVIQHHTPDELAGMSHIEIQLSAARAATVC